MSYILDLYEVPYLNNVNNVNNVNKVIIPGSKSITNRAFLLSALSSFGLKDKENINLEGCLESDDTLIFYKCLVDLGFQVEHIKKNTFRFYKVNIEDIRQKWRQYSKDNAISIYCHDAGTAVRFLIPLIAALGGGVKVTASKQMSDRPIQALLEALEFQGVEFSYGFYPGSLPLYVNINRNNYLKGGEVLVDTKESSQFISGLLMTAPLAAMPTELMLTQTRRQSYIDMTVKMMHEFGFNFDTHNSGNHYLVDNKLNNKLNNKNMVYYIEPDASTASYFFALAALTGNSIKVKGFDYRVSLQGDVAFLDVLSRMGAKVSYISGYTQVEGPKILQGFGLENPIDVSAFSDTFMTLAAIAPFADKPIHITGISHTRKQESDRVHAMAVGLKRLGVNVDEMPDDLIIYPAKISSLRGNTVSSYSDHRIAMSLALIGVKVPGVVIEGAGAVSKTCPDYFALLDSCRKCQMSN